MENVCHKSLENTGDAELTAESTETEPWDSIGVSSKSNILSTSLCSEEHVLKCTFKACDPEQTGEVSVFRIIEYLQEMTGQSCEDWRFQSLYARLDPEERGIAVDFPTFHHVMKDWIADCRQDGSQQALEQARLVANELEDLKFFSRSLEEENSRLHAQDRQREKEQQSLLIQVDNLQEENRKLLLEKESYKNKIKQLCTEKVKMKSQLCECENLISCKDTALNKKEKRTEELTVTLDEYQMMVQELKLEVNRLQEQLCHSQEAGEGLPRNSLDNVKTSCIQAPTQPLSIEIEESQKQECGEDNGLPSPLCGMTPSFATCRVVPEECGALTEDLAECSSLPEITAVSSAVSSAEQFLDIPFWYLLLHILQKLVLFGLLFACVSLLTIVYLVLPYGHLVWTESRRNPWSQLQVTYLRPPPI